MRRKGESTYWCMPVVLTLYLFLSFFSYLFFFLNPCFLFPGFQVSNTVVLVVVVPIWLGLFGPAVHSSPNGPTRPLVLLLHHWRAPVSHLFSLGVLGSFASLGLLRPFS